MPDVILDGEKVAFNGPAPASFSEVRAVLEEVLAGQGRVLAALTFDGQPFDESQGNQPLGAARVEAVSLALADAVAQVGAALVPELDALQERADALAGAVLRAPWGEIQARCLQEVEAATHVLQRAVEVAAIGGEESAAARAVTTLAGATEQWLELVRTSDAGALALHLDGVLAPALRQLAALWRERPAA